MLGIVPRRVYEADANSFALKPIGSGPFQVESFVPGNTINLIAFREYMQRIPRLDRLQISTISDVNQLAEKVLKNSVGAAVLPYSEQLYNQFKNLPNFTVVTVLNASLPLLDMQPSPGINERQLNAFDTNWNTYLWYR